MKYTIILLAALMFGCTTTKEVQVQKGTYLIIKDKIEFIPTEHWHSANSLPDTVYRVQIVAVSKHD